MIENLTITNPKRRSSTPVGRDEWFPYYAGFSGVFARQIIRSSGLSPGALILDPWNGSGTTTSAASLYGYRSVGFDINPAMVVAAKARLLPGTELPSIGPLLAEIEKKARSSIMPRDDGDSLLTWFMPESAARIRSIDRAIHTLLVSNDLADSTAERASKLSTIAAFYYVALFRTVRSLLGRFTRSNPTWIIRPANPQSRIRPTRSDLTSLFRQHIRSMSANIESEPVEWDFSSSHCTISVASSECLPVADRSVDFILSSPPYCTRIDYGVATSPELAVLGFRLAEQLPELRKQLIGTPTIQDVLPAADTDWGPTCNDFLMRLHSHPSKAAKSYYYKTFVQYFSGISVSLSELSRCMKPGAHCVIVVQDSYFKNLRVDLASIFVEIGRALRLPLSRRVDFLILRTFASINTRSRNYRLRTSATESILCLTRN
jgi:SAM-dependent methyltransferase